MTRQAEKRQNLRQLVMRQLWNKYCVWNKRGNDKKEWGKINEILENYFWYDIDYFLQACNNDALFQISLRKYLQQVKYPIHKEWGTNVKIK